DRFGNAQVNLGPDDIDGWGDRVRLRLGDRTRTAVVARSYGELGPGQVGLVVDSYGLLAVSLERRSAADELHLAAGDAVVVEPIPDDAPERPPPAPVRLTRPGRGPHDSGR